MTTKPDDRERRLETIMVADIVGYSRLMDADEEATYTALRSVRSEVLDPKIEEYGAHVVKHLGDGFLAEFPTAMAAIQFAMSFQEEMGRRAEGVPKDHQIKLRIGVNLGDVIVDEDGDIFGDGVNVAARLEALAIPGGICISGPVYETVHKQLDVGFDDLGKQSVKNISSPVHAYDVRWPGEAGTPDERVVKPTPKPKPVGLMAGGAVIVAALIGLALWQMSPFELEVMTESDKSIAVLPFADFSPSGDHGWFADGLTEEILNSLARTADLQVASRTSSFAYRGATEGIPAIAKALDVAHILEGSVRRAGERLRVTVQLIRASDDKHLWSETFDGSIEDSIAIQEEIAFAIARALQTAMDPEELARMVAAGTRSVEAWETYLRGRALDQQISNQAGSDDIFDAIALFDRAVELDPEFADAHLMLAELWQSQISPTDTMYVVSGLPLAERQAHYNDAIRAAIKHARSEATRLEAEMRAADFDLRIMDQIALAEQMTVLEPERRQGWSWLNFLYMTIGEYEKSREAGLKAWAAKPEPGSGRSPIIQTMHRVNLSDAVAMVDEVFREPNPTPSEVYQSHRVLLAAGNTERAAGLVDMYLRQSSDHEGQKLMQIRQACAEGRVADADALFEVIDPDSNSRWLFLITLGRDDEARELLLTLDTPETVFILGGYMTYRSFEARDYPLLWKVLTAQGINRPPARPMAYRCERKTMLGFFEKLRHRYEIRECVAYVIAIYSTA